MTTNSLSPVNTVMYYRFTKLFSIESINISPIEIESIKSSPTLVKVNGKWIKTSGESRPYGAWEKGRLYGHNIDNPIDGFYNPDELYAFLFQNKFLSITKENFYTLEYADYNRLINLCQLKDDKFTEFDYMLQSKDDKSSAKKLAELCEILSIKKKSKELFQQSRYQAKRRVNRSTTRRINQPIA